MTTPIKKNRKERRAFTAMEKCEAVLSIWSERRTMQEVCVSMQISYTLLAKWQNTALDAMVTALSPKETEQPLTPMLSSRLEKLLTKKVATKMAPHSGKQLSQRLSSVQKAP